MDPSVSPLPESRRIFLSRCRLLARIVGPRLGGKILTLLSRGRLISSDLKTYYVLSSRPPIIYLGNVMRHLFDIAELLKDRPVHFIKNFYQTFEREDRLQELTQQLAFFRSLYPQHRIHFICATEREQALFHRHGLQPAYFVSINAFVDDQMFRIMPSQGKRFDALYNAQLHPVKRHELAAKVRSLALMGYVHQRLHDHVADYARRMRQMFSHAVWLNEPEHPVPPHDVPALLNQARVGLCLSAEEGAMAASMEYLLCGLPVVSTRSLGGRDVFFDPDYVKIVEDDPQAVADGVQEMVEQEVDPGYIRQRTLEKIATHRERFISLVEQILKDAGSPRGFRDEFDRLFVNKLRVSAPFPGAFLSHIATGMPVAMCQQLVQQHIH